MLVGSLERSTLRLLGLVENLLASARLETGDWAMRSEAVDLAEVAREAAVLLAPLFEQRRQRVELPADDAAWVVGDRTQLLQVVLNLLGNANKFAPEGTRVRIAGERDGGETVLRVEDEGPGLPPGDEASLFGRYRRSAAPRDRTAPASGSGSCTPSCGATAAAWRPRRAPRAAPASPCDSRRRGCRGVKLLVVDDDPELRPLVGFALRQAATWWSRRPPAKRRWRRSTPSCPT